MTHIFLKAILLLTGETDVFFKMYGYSYPISMETHENVPFMFWDWYTYWVDRKLVACPLPKRISSFYNIITPFSQWSWIFVSSSIVVTAGAFIFIDHVYKSLPQISSGWKW